MKPAPVPPAVRHLTSVFDLRTEEIRALFRLADRMREPAEARRPVLAGRCIGLLFQKPSMRTRVSFETAAAHLHAHAIFMTDEVGVGRRERVDDFARVISSYLDALVVRTFSHQLVEDLARYAACPVINGLSDYAHPCQALSDLWTIQRRLGRLDGVRLVFVGDGNNVARSLAACCARLGVHFTLAAPPGYAFDPPFLDRLRREQADHLVACVPDPLQAVQGADVLYTDVWASMGQEHQAAQRRQVFQPYQVNEALVARAKPSVLVMHCLPAHRGEEITSEVLDGPQSIVVEQAANRLPLQAALLRWLIAPETCGDLA